MKRGEQMAVDGGAPSRHEYFVGSASYSVYRDGMEIQSAIAATGSRESAAVCGAARSSHGAPTERARAAAAAGRAQRRR